MSSRFLRLALLTALTCILGAGVRSATFAAGSASPRSAVDHDALAAGTHLTNDVVARPLRMPTPGVSTIPPRRHDQRVALPVATAHEAPCAGRTPLYTLFRVYRL